LSDSQISRLKEQLEQKYQGVWNSGRPMVLEGGLKFDRIGMTAVEADWLRGIECATKNICLALGVEPTLLGDSAHRTYNTFKDAEKSFYISTVIPLLEKIRDSFLNNWLLPRFNMGDGYYFQFDLEAIEVMTDVRNSLWERMISGVESQIITINEAREELGYSELNLPAETAPQVEEEESPSEG
jgi:HK97 family phage portal protein